MLAQRVAAGNLLPVEERLPENPLVIVPPHQNGPSGRETWALWKLGLPMRDW